MRPDEVTWLSPVAPCALRRMWGLRARLARRSKHRLSRMGTDSAQQIESLPRRRLPRRRELPRLLELDPRPAPLHAGVRAHGWETGTSTRRGQLHAGRHPSRSDPSAVQRVEVRSRAGGDVSRAGWAEFAASARRASRGAPRSGQRDLEASSGKALLCHQDAAYLDHLDPPNMTTCWMALDDTAADTGTIYYVRGSHRWPHASLGGTFHAPDDWLAHAHASLPARRRARPRPDRGSGRRRRLPRRVDLSRQSANSVPTPSGGRSSATRSRPTPVGTRRVPSHLLALPPARRGRARRGVLSDPLAGRVPDAVARGLLRPQRRLSMFRRSLTAITLVLAGLAASSGSATAARKPPVAPPGLRFYTPPGRPIAGPRGSIIWSHPGPHAGALSAARSATLVLYRSVLPNGTPRCRDSSSRHATRLPRAAGSWSAGPMARPAWPTSARHRAMRRATTCTPSSTAG